MLGFVRWTSDLLSHNPFSAAGKYFVSHGLKLSFVRDSLDSFPELLLT
jgi:hypothetical protein